MLFLTVIFSLRSSLIICFDVMSFFRILSLSFFPRGCKLKPSSLAVLSFVNAILALCSAYVNICVTICSSYDVRPNILFLGLALDSPVFC